MRENGKVKWITKLKVIEMKEEDKMKKMIYKLVTIISSFYGCYSFDVHMAEISRASKLLHGCNLINDSLVNIWRVYNKTELRTGGVGQSLINFASDGEEARSLRREFPVSKHAEFVVDFLRLYVAAAPLFAEGGKFFEGRAATLHSLDSIRL
jgi:hypothetical protein